MTDAINQRQLRTTRRELAPWRSGLRCGGLREDARLDRRRELIEGVRDLAGPRVGDRSRRAAQAEPSRCMAMAARVATLRCDLRDCFPMPGRGSAIGCRSRMSEALLDVLHPRWRRASRGAGLPAGPRRHRSRPGRSGGAPGRGIRAAQPAPSHRATDPLVRRRRPMRCAAAAPSSMGARVEPPAGRCATPRQIREVVQIGRTRTLAAAYPARSADAVASLAGAPAPGRAPR